MFTNDLAEDRTTKKTSRRAFLLSAAGVGGGLLLEYGYFFKKTATAEAGPADKHPWARRRQVDIVEFTDSGERKETVHVPKLVKSENEWKQQLSPGAYNVTREEGTERAFTGRILGQPRAGNLSLHLLRYGVFSSDTKFESGTGWPSFYQPIAEENVEKSTIPLLACGERQWNALVATRTWATSSTMARGPRDSAIA